MFVAKQAKSEWHDALSSVLNVMVNFQMVLWKIHHDNPFQKKHL